MRNLMLAAVAALTFSAPALAVSAVNSPGALGATDFIDWAQLGAQGIVRVTPVAVSSNGGGSATVTSAGGIVSRIDQGSGWFGNFTNGDVLIWTGGVGPDLTISFASPVAGAGAQWQANFFGAFGANLKAYDSADNLLGTVTRDGNSNSAGDGSAIFLGVLSSEVNISKIVLTLDYAWFAPQDFAINRLLLTGTPGGGVIPEPGTWAMLIAGFGMVGFVARRRKVAHAA
jgi:hypothetical protein